jgi:hypothetical protein
MKKNLLHFITGTILMVSILSCTGNKTSGNADASDSTKTDSLKADSTDIIHWQDVSNEEAIAFIEEFYSHAPKESNAWDWDEAILHKYLAPAVLDTLHALVGTSFTDAEEGTKYATWLLTGIDNSEQICVSRKNITAIHEKDGRYRKHFEVYYWADGMLDGVQELYYTVKSDGNRLFITRIDSLDESGAQQAWDMLEERNRWREVEMKAEEMGGFENLSESVMDSLYEHALD